MSLGTRTANVPGELHIEAKLQNTPLSSNHRTANVLREHDRTRAKQPEHAGFYLIWNKVLKLVTKLRSDGLKLTKVSRTLCRTRNTALD